MKRAGTLARRTRRFLGVNLPFSDRPRQNPAAAENLRSHPADSLRGRPLQRAGHPDRRDLCLQRRAHLRRKLQYSRHIGYLHVHGRSSRPPHLNRPEHLHHRDTRRPEKASADLPAAQRKAAGRRASLPEKAAGPLQRQRAEGERSTERRHAARPLRTTAKAENPGRTRHQSLHYFRTASRQLHRQRAARRLRSDALAGAAFGGEEPPPGPVMAGVFEGAGHWRLDFIDGGVLVNCSYLSPNQESYKLDFKNNRTAVIINTKPKPLVLTLRADGTMVGPGPLRSTESLPAVHQADQTPTPAADTRTSTE